MKRKEQAGFTLIEVIVALLLGILVVTMVTGVVSSGLKHLRFVKNTKELHSNSVFLANTFSYWIKQGESISVPSPSVLEIRLPDDSVKTIENDSGIVKIDTVSFTPDNIEILGLVFTKLARSVKVSLDLQVKGSGETFSISTTIAQRNVF